MEKLKIIQQQQILGKMIKDTFILKHFVLNSLMAKKIAKCSRNGHKKADCFYMTC
ncbi:hypothetical protein C820_001250 [Clostridium sp. MD294]|nr:hypothetical protein C820_001250 [Clostridium sp. MD294]